MRWFTEHDNHTQNIDAHFWFFHTSWRPFVSQNFWGQIVNVNHTLHYQSIVFVDLLFNGTRWKGSNE